MSLGSKAVINGVAAACDWLFMGTTFEDAFADLHWPLTPELSISGCGSVGS